MGKKNDTKNSQQRNGNFLKSKYGKYLIGALCLLGILRYFFVGVEFSQLSDDKSVRERCADSARNNTDSGCDYDDLNRQSDLY